MTGSTSSCSTRRPITTARRPLCRRDRQGLSRQLAALRRPVAAGAEIAGGLLPGWKPDLVHVHDWQAALTPVYMRFGSDAGNCRACSPSTTSPSRANSAPTSFPSLRLPPDAFSMEGVEYYGDVGFLKGGLQTANAITTVSPSYAEEILTPEFGMGLEGCHRQPR